MANGIGGRIARVQLAFRAGAVAFGTHSTWYERHELRAGIYAREDMRIQCPNQSLNAIRNLLSDSPSSCFFLVPSPQISFSNIRIMGENSQKTQCQTCFAVFDKHQTLRDHVDAYQREAHALMARLREVQAHLPPLDEQNQACHGSLNEDDRDFDDNDDEDTDRDDFADLDGLICPYPTCDRKEAFKTKQAQIRHYETHVPCYEICVFCRDSFVQVRKYIAHICKAKATSYDQWRDQYRKERCTQLHRQAAEKLDEMLDLDSKAPRKEDSRKRARDAEEKCADQVHTYKRLRTAYSVSDGHGELRSNPRCHQILI
ncbi:hypothetical protein BDP55DRAFT_637745 [Colletotrichum godetiae]|uniref:Uncharacterized protein n=1 Tax=Colletotrichum godetiae TaxID=1209918 RepID=A0AAJ0A9L9_9PEZI|nr:uncharacterized protein BDP55DRAFT_637745 [Colletotrichum godetiae]KAK1658514.1 hypothetical protein BDP55DRAFT_637745 [Colletotrichum godetiae]